MEPMTGHDASFLYMETPTNFHSVCVVFTLDASTMPDGFSMDTVRKLMTTKVHELPALAEKPWRPWYDLGHPAWVTDESFDLNRHLRRRHVPAPGTDVELVDVCAEILSQRMDLSRPLWEMWFLDGLADGTVAVVFKIHSAFTDGTNFTSLFNQLCDAEPTRLTFTHAAGPAQPLPLVLHGLRTLVLKPFIMVRLLAKAIVPQLTRSAPKLPPGVPKPLSAPRTSFNTVLTRNRNVAWVSLDAAVVRQVKSKLGITINDVVLALTSSALRRYLLERNELPGESLLTYVPIAVHDDAELQGRNQTTGMLTSLETLVDDPVERALAIARTTDAAKAHSQAYGPELVHDWAELTAPYWGKLFRLYSRLRLADRHAVMHNLVISNMGGRFRDLNFAGARIKSFVPLGAPMDGGAMFVAIASIDEQLNFGLVACPEIIPELSRIADYIDNALDELAAAVYQRSDPAPRANRIG